MDNLDPTAVSTKTNATFALPVAPPQGPFKGRSIGVDYAVRQLIASLPLMIADALAVSATLAVASLLTFTTLSYASWVCLGLALPAAYALAGLYPGIALYPVVELRRCSLATAAALVIFAGSAAASGTGAASLLLLLGIVGPIALVCVPFFRAIARRVAARFDLWAQPVMIFGSGPQAAEIYKALAVDRRCGLRPLGFVDAVEAQWIDTAMDPNWYLGAPEHAADIAAETGAYWAIVSSSVDEGLENHRSLETFASTLPHRLYASGVAPRQLSISDQTRSVGSITMLYRRDLLALPGPRLAKRTLDYAIALAVAVLAIPLMAIIGGLIKVTSRGPVMYAADRLGRRGQSFKTHKFRTMRAGAAKILERYLAENPEWNAEWQEKHKLTNDPRVTSLGNVLRKTSLDELPQLFNVLKGEMSLVGPRPIVEDEIQRYDEAYEAYCRVLPGITGLWQVSGRNDTTYEQRIEYDKFYVQNWSPWLDLHILARTIKVVLTQDGAY